MANHELVSQARIEKMERSAAMQEMAVMNAAMTVFIQKRQYHDMELHRKMFGASK